MEPLDALFFKAGAGFGGAGGIEAGLGGVNVGAGEGGVDAGQKLVFFDGVVVVDKAFGDNAADLGANLDGGDSFKGAGGGDDGSDIRSFKGRFFPCPLGGRASGPPEGPTNEEEEDKWDQDQAEAHRGRCNRLGGGMLVLGIGLG